MVKERKKYSYYGIVKDKFNNILNRNFFAETEAISKEKALNNCAHQYKRNKNLSRDSKVILDEKYLTELYTVSK